MDGSEHQLYKVVKLNGQEKYECAACKRVLSRQQTMETHMRSVHRYVGPALFEKKYRLYKDDPSKKIPRQTLHNKMKAQSSHRGEPMLSVEHFLALPEQLTYSNMEIQDQDRTLSATFIDAAIDADESADLENGYYINTSDNESETSSLLSSDNDDSIVTDSVSDDSDCGANEDNTNEVNCGPSTLQSISMAIMAYVSRHCLTNEAAKDLIDVIKLCCPTVDSVQSLNFPQVQEICGQCEITVFDICNVCHSLFPVDENVYHCQTEACDGLRYKGDLSQQSRKRHKNGFATVNILEQLRHLLEREGIWETIQHRISNRGKQVLTDIIDGSYYKALCRKGGFLSNTNNISLIFNTDGAPLYSSSSVSLWPVFLAVNELPSPHRFSKQNMLMWGIWQGKGKPPFNVYFEPFATHMTNLYETGLQIKPWKLRNAVTVKVAVLLGSLDLQGKAYLLNMTQHNGENGCGTCKEPGVVVKQGKGHTRCYPFRDDNERPAKRTCNSFINDGISAHQGKVVVNGLFDMTSLALMRWFDIVIGIVPDYMHGCLLGITKTLLKCWFSAKNHKMPYFIGGELNRINKRLLEMRPPDTLARLPRDMEKHFKNLKASELQAWLLYYSLPCLVGILPDIYLQHFAQFSEGIYILLGDSITPNQLSRARDLLLRFYKDFAELYGEGTCGLNVHNAGQHLADYAEGWGPLWAWSTFGFEDMNGTLMDFAHGTGNVCRQLIWMLHAQSRLRCDVNLMENCSIKQFIECMLSTKRQLRSLKKANDCQVTGGTKKVQNLQQPIGEAITRILGSDAVWMVNRIVVNGHVYFSKQYTRMVKRNACVVQFTDDTLGEIEFFVWEKKSGKVLAIFKEIEVDSNKPFFFNDVGLHAVRVKSDRSDLKAKNVTEILEKIMLLNGNSRNHVIIRFPNFNGVCG